MGEEESTGTHNRPENNNSLLKIASIVDAPVTFFRGKTHINIAKLKYLPKIYLF